MRYGKTFELVTYVPDRESAGLARDFPKLFEGLALSRVVMERFVAKSARFAFLRYVESAGCVVTDARRAVLARETCERLWALGEFSRRGLRLSLSEGCLVRLHRSREVPCNGVVCTS